VRERRSPLTPEYTFSEASQRYRNMATGKYIKREVVRRALDTALDRSRNEVQRLSRALVNGNMSIAEWQVATAKEIKSMHLASASLAKGGWAQMGPREFGKVGNTLRNEYGYLAKFAEQIKDGTQRLDGSLISRANLYAQGPRGTYHAIEARGMLDQGKAECRNVLGGSDHNCEGCLAETAKGWMQLGELTPIGDRQCLSNCRCSVEYK
jgi:hypothetical protein